LNLIPLLQLGKLLSLIFFNFFLQNILSRLDDRMLEKVYAILPEAMIPLMNSKGITYKPAEFHERNESIEAEFG
jgi:hypothetical protein